MNFRYDNYFLYKATRKLGKRVKLIRRGTSIIQMSVKQLALKVVDSYLFVPCALGQFPKVFGLNSGEKGFFPHGLNTTYPLPEHTDDSPNFCKAELPPLKFFVDKYTKPKVYKETEAWWLAENQRLQETGELYDMRQTELRYCSQDVRILREGMECFIEQCMQKFGVHPFKKTTLPSYLNAVYR